MPAPEQSGSTTTATRPPVDPLGQGTGPPLPQQQAHQNQQSAHPLLTHHPLSLTSGSVGAGDQQLKSLAAHKMPITTTSGTGASKGTTEPDSGKVRAASSGPPLTSAVSGTTATAHIPVAATPAAGPTTHTILSLAAATNHTAANSVNLLKAVPTAAIARVTGSIIQETKSGITHSQPQQILIAPNSFVPAATAHPIRQELSSAATSNALTTAVAAGTLTAAPVLSSAGSALLQHQPVSLSSVNAAISTSVPTISSTGSVGATRILSSSAALAVATAAAVQPLSVINSNSLSASGSVTLTPSSSQTSTGASSAATAAQMSAAAHSAAFQRLKVEDALSYLDQVKLRFSDQPQVYNDFLDIMKEFKSQAIDTPGVIQRVSTLFRGHVELIVGFNTFLPPGYKIEMHANEQVSVSMPSSTFILQTGISSSQMRTEVPNLSVTSAPVTQPVHMGSATLYSQSSRSAAGNRVVHPNAQSIGNSLSGISGGTAIVTTNSGKQVSSSADAGVVSNSAASHAPAAAVLHSASLSSATGMHNQALGSHGTPNGSNAVTAVSSAQTSAPAANAQPVEFNHAINYVNKIKNRFQGQPEVYKQFLEILHTYQKEQKSTKENTSLTESAVYQQVAKLFQNQTDLLQEFGQFLPDANGGGGFFSATTISSNPSSAASNTAHQVDMLAAAHRAASNDHGAIVKKPLVRPGVLTHNANIQIKRLNSQSNFSINKRIKMTSLRDVSHAEAGKVGSLNEYAFFDKVRKALRSQEVYENFLRCLVMYNHEIVSRIELVHLVNPFLGRFPELLKSFKEFLGHKDGVSVGNNVSDGSAHRVVGSSGAGGMRDRDRGERMTTETGIEIDYATCKRYGASYRALPKNYPQPKCSGRTQLCREVLNDTWVSFPSWSEDSTFVTSKKTQYEEYISKCEDERYELDVVIETNLATIRVLEAVDRKLSRLAPEERAKFRLDDHLGGTSATIHQRAIRRIYGDKAAEIIDGLKKNPVVAVPIVLRRLKNKEEEWREAQKSFNKIWREQNERYYLKSLDHQGISFKQNDIKFLRSKNLLSEVENLFEERHEMEDAMEQPIAPSTGPHLTLDYKDKSMIDEACSLIIHHIKRQTSIHKEDKEKIKQLMRHFVPDLFATPRGELSDDEGDDMDFDREDPKTIQSVKLATTSSSCSTAAVLTNGKGNEAISGDKETSAGAIEASKQNSGDGEYTLFFCNNNWYLFFRLHCILCQRLAKMYERSQIIAAEEAKEKSNRKESTAIALRLKPKNEIDAEEYFPYFVDMIKQVLDGNLDGNTFEDTLREMFGIHAYIGFTMDKVVQNICRQLQHLACDETCSACTELFLDEMKSSVLLPSAPSSEPQSTRSQHEASYQRNAEKLLTDENCFKLMFFKSDGRVTIELLDTESPESEAEIGRWSAYVDKYVRDDETISDELKERLTLKPVFLPRNIANWRKKCAVGNSEDFAEKSRSNSQQSQENVPADCCAPPSAATANDLKDQTPSDEKMDTDCSKASDGSPDVGKEGADSSAVAADLSLKDVVVHDNEQCRFNVNSYKMLYIVEGESYIYRKNSLKRAKDTHKRVSQKLFKRFSELHGKWLEQADPEASSSCQRWLEGTADPSEGLADDERPQKDGTVIEGPDSTEVPTEKRCKSTRKENRTKKVTLEYENRAPFRTFYRYVVEKDILETS